MPKQISYKEQISHPNWQKKRLEILNRDEWACKFCGDKETTLHVHHKSYEWGKKPWEYEESNFISLCEDCHDIVEWQKKNDYTVIGCIALRTKDGLKSHILATTSDLDIFIFYKHTSNNEGDINGKELIVAFPIHIYKQIDNFIKSFQ